MSDYFNKLDIDGSQYNVSDTEFNSKFDEKKDVFSTEEEVKTNKVWIDGKPIYKKTFNYSSSPKSIVKSTWVSFSDIDMTGKQLIKYDIKCHNTTSETSFGVNFGLLYQIATNILKLYNSLSWDLYLYNITIYYTKTID